MIKLLIAHRYPLIRAGLLASLVGVSDLEIVGNTAEADEIEACLCERLPDVVLVDDNVTFLSRYKEVKSCLFILATSSNEETFFTGCDLAWLRMILSLLLLRI